MNTLTPRIASELAEAVYQIRKPNIAGRYMFQTTSAVSDHFSFDLSKGPVTGQSGGVAGWFHKTSGFAIVGHGRGRYQNDTVVAVRGSKHGQDWLTNFHVGYAIGHNGGTVRLKYENRHQARFSGEWADRLSAALITLLKDAGYYTFVVTQASIGTSLTFYDMLARTLEKISAASARFAGQTRGLLGHMLVFAGFVTRELGKLTYRVIREVFRLAMGALYRAVRIAIDRD